MQGSGASAGDLIVVRADGRGGCVRVVQSINFSASLHDNSENLPSFKRYVCRTKSSSFQSQRFLQIDSFFKRVCEYLYSQCLWISSCKVSIEDEENPFLYSI